MDQAKLVFTCSGRCWLQVHRSVNACLCPLYAIEGMQVVTVEGKYEHAMLRHLSPAQILMRPHTALGPASLVPVFLIAGIGSNRKGLHPVQVRKHAGSILKG